MFSLDRYGRKESIERVKNKNNSSLYANEILVTNHCGLIQQFYIDNSDIEKYYNDDQFYAQHVVAVEWFEKERLEHERKDWFSYYKFLANRMNSDLPLLDVGCGAGWFIDWWQDNYQEVCIGIEPSETAKYMANYRAARYIFLRIENAKNELDYSKQWNILMNLVVEHIPDPVSFIQKYLPYIGEKGTLTIVVPNDFSPLQQWLGSTHFIQKVHVNYFTPKSLYDTIYKALPENDPAVKYIIDMSATFPMEVFELLGFHYIENGNIGKYCHKTRLFLEKVFGQKMFKLYQYLYDKYGIGRELVFTVRRA